MPPRTEVLQASRERWNDGIRALGFGLWIFPLAVFWMRFLPPLRPFGFQAPPPHWSSVLAAFVCCVMPFTLPKAWFRPFWFENRRFYERLGIRLFRHAVPDGDWVSRRLRTLDSGYRLIRNRSELSRHLSESLMGERTHLAFLLAGVATNLYAWRLGETGLSAALFAGNGVFNVYPVLLQRYKRARISRRRVA